MARSYRKPKQPGEAPTRDLNRAAKTIMALDLAKQGKTWRQIGEAVGLATGGRALNPGSVHKMVQEELNRCISYEVGDYRKLQNERLNQLYDAMLAKALDGSTWHAKECREIIATQNKLMGLDVVPEQAQAAAPPIIREYPEGVAEAV